VDFDNLATMGFYNTLAYQIAQSGRAWPSYWWFTECYRPFSGWGIARSNLKTKEDNELQQE